MRRPSFASWLIVIHMAATCCRYATAEYIKKPTFFPKNGLFLQPGETGTLICQVNAPADMRIDMWWEFRNQKRIENNTIITVGHVTETLDAKDLERKIGQIQLIIHAVQENETDGKYTCKVQNLEQKNHVNYDSVEVTVGNGIRYKASIKIANITSGRRPLRLEFEYRSFPKPVFHWTKDELDAPLRPSSKYNFSESDSKATLSVSNPTAEDAGTYVLHGDNGIAKNSDSIRVYVRTKPILSMEPVLVKPSEQATLTCTCVGYPKPTMNFAFFACNDTPWKNCSKSVLPEQVDQFGTRTRSSKDYIAVEQFTIPQANTPGFVVCAAKNEAGSAMVQADLLISSFQEPVTIRRDSSEVEVVQGDRVTIVCAASVYSITNEIEFFWNGNLVNESEVVKFQDSYESYAHVRKLVVKNVQKSYEGVLKCRAKSLESQIVESKEIRLEIFDSMKPKIFGESDHEQIAQHTGEACQLECNSEGFPKPTVRWLKNGEPLVQDNRIQMINGTTLVFTYLKREDSGQYLCRVENREGLAEKRYKLTVTPEIVERTWIYAGLAMLIVLIFIVVLITVFYCKKRKEVAAMRKAGLINFEEGYKGQLNPNLLLGEQTDLLPYDSRYEFPKENLTLGKTLGSGAFGVVIEAIAYEILPNEKKTTVAVKMVRKHTDNIVMRALISELKIMIHLGPNPNVVNLLGAITKNVVKRELMVIVEYCPHGNLQDYLSKHRRSFMDQFSEIDGSLDNSWSRNGSIDSSPFTNDSNNNTGSENVSNPTNSTYICNNSNYVGRSTDSYSPGRINPALVEDDPGPTTTVTTTDLISWSAQIASGMEYLTHRLVIHGDLAARNVLLAENNVVKICDFGLARSIYHRSDHYRKKGSDPLPFKWLALECIEQSLFSAQSDVWSYGILLWELFSLATNPYPGMNNCEELFVKLQQGYRMDKPLYANKAVYEIMRQCWRVRPATRPTFWELKALFSNMLPEEMKQPTDLNDLNGPYLTASNGIGPNSPNYVMNVKPPQEVAPPVPKEYLSMKCASIPNSEVISMVHVDQTIGLSPMSAVSNPSYTSAVNVKSL